MCSNSGKGCLLKTTYLSSPIISLTTTQCFPFMHPNSSTSKTEPSNPVSLIAWNLFPHIRTSIIKSFAPAQFTAKILCRHPIRLILPIRNSLSTSFSSVLLSLLHLLLPFEEILVTKLFKVANDVAEITIVNCGRALLYVVCCENSYSIAKAFCFVDPFTYHFAVDCHFRAFCHSYPHGLLSLDVFFIGIGMLQGFLGANEKLYA